MAGPRTFHKWPLHGSVGVALAVCFWILNWTLPGLRTQWGFFPLWLGFALTVDAVVFFRKADSPFTRDAAAYAGLFFASAPAWWLFELINVRTRNWFYLGGEAFTSVEFAFFSTISFSTVMPSVFAVAELIGTLRPVRRLPTGPAVPCTRGLLSGMFLAGLLTLSLLLTWPDLFFPLLWVSVYFILEPVNVKLGNRSLLEDLARGNWRQAVALSLGAVVCGIFWETWNYYSYPKWIYRIPYAGGLKVFEMPLAGYLGYLPFSFELFALYHFIAGPFRRGRSGYYLHLIDKM